MINASQIKEHMEVKGSDGKHVGTVLGVQNGRLNLASGGMHHDIDIEMVDAIKGRYDPPPENRRENRSHLALRQLKIDLASSQSGKQRYAQRWAWRLFHASPGWSGVIVGIHFDKALLPLSDAQA
jgi:hypothetical protein